MLMRGLLNSGRLQRWGPVLFLVGFLLLLLPLVGLLGSTLTSREVAVELTLHLGGGGRPDEVGGSWWKGFELPEMVNVHLAVWTDDDGLFEVWARGEGFVPPDIFGELILRESISKFQTVSLSFVPPRPGGYLVWYAVEDQGEDGRTTVGVVGGYRTTEQFFDGSRPASLALFGGFAVAAFSTALLFVEPRTAPS